MLGKYIDKLMPTIGMVVWIMGIGYIVLSLNTCLNNNEVQEVVTPKTIDEKIDSLKDVIWHIEYNKIDHEFSLDSLMAVIPKEIKKNDKLIEWGKKDMSDTTDNTK